MKFLKRNKNIIIALVIFFIGILLCVKIKNILVPNDGAAVYGNRLDGKVEISKNLKNDISSKIDSATEVDIRVSGRIINVTLTLPSDVSKDAAKEFAKKSLDAFSTDEKSYYDIQFFLVKKDETEGFPILGYKIQNADNITWTKDR